MNIRNVVSMGLLLIVDSVFNRIENELEAYQGDFLGVGSSSNFYTYSSNRKDVRINKQESPKKFTF